MKRLALLLAAVVACVLFTACPDKPVDEFDMPVAIPDGIYQERCEPVYSFCVFDRGDTMECNDINQPVYDTVEIVNGRFIYNPCNDTTYWGGKTLIYESKYYCETGRVPAYVTSDGYVHIDTVCIFIPFDTCYRHPVYRYDNGYRFENVIHYPVYLENGEHFWDRFHKYIHTLTPLSNQ